MSPNSGNTRDKVQRTIRNHIVSSKIGATCAAQWEKKTRCKIKNTFYQNNEKKVMLIKQNMQTKNLELLFGVLVSGMTIRRNLKENRFYVRHKIKKPILLISQKMLG